MCEFLGGCNECLGRNCFLTEDSECVEEEHTENNCSHNFTSVS